MRGGGGPIPGLDGVPPFRVTPHPDGVPPCPDLGKGYLCNSERMGVPPGQEWWVPPVIQMGVLPPPPQVWTYWCLRKHYFPHYFEMRVVKYRKLYLPACWEPLDSSSCLNSQFWWFYFFQCTNWSILLMFRFLPTSTTSENSEMYFVFLHDTNTAQSLNNSPDWPKTFHFIRRCWNFRKYKTWVIKAC